jgi:ketosteroid isomerase-like protein
VIRRLAQRRVRAVFAALSEGDYETALAGLADNIHHRFAGEHPLGGERHDKAAVRLWFERLFRLFPELRFTVTKTAATGWPWDMTVVAEWEAQVTPQLGGRYVNKGAHVVRVRRGRVVCLHAYEDSQAVAAACQQMAAHGIAEAAAPPIES